MQKPSADQEWDPVDVFRNLSKIREATKGNPVEKVLASIPPRQNGIIACVDDLLERAKYQASTKPPIPAAAVVKDKDAIQRGIAQEWKVLEEEFLLNVCQVVERTVETATTLCKRAETLKVSLCQNKTKPKRNQAEVLENEILDLQQKIRDKRDELKLLEASEAPSSALHCQASSHLGLFGFRLDCYTGNSLQLSFEHVVEGVESCFAFDLKTASLTASRITGATSSCQNPIPANHVAAKFHQYFLKTMLSNGTIIPLLPQVEPLELQETILALSRWLGRLDLAALDLAVISKRSSVTLDLPQVSIAFPNGLLIRASYDNDRNHLKQCFLPSQVFIKEPGQAERLHELPSDVTPGNCFQRIFETIA